MQASRKYSLKMMKKQPREALKQTETVCYNCGKKGHYASQCRMEHEPACYRCGKKGHGDSKCRLKVEIPPTCTYCHWVGHTVAKCFVKRSNEAVAKQYVRLAKNSEPTKAKRAGPPTQNSIMFLREDDSVKEENTLAAFKRSANGGTLTKQ